MKAQIHEYDQMVKEFIEKDSPVKFCNLTKEHAKFIIKAFIDSAKESIEILSGACFGEFYKENDFYDSLKHAASQICKPGKIRIITIGDDKSESAREHFEGINREIGCRVIDFMPCKYKNPDKPDPLSHFIVVDRKRYRKEEPHTPVGTPETVKAEVCCNDKDTAGMLSNTFDVVWKTISTAAVNA